MRTFNILGEQIVIDEPGERYHEIREFVDKNRHKIFEYLKNSCSYAETNSEILSIIENESPVLYADWMNNICVFLKEKYGYECTDRQFFEEVVNTQIFNALQIEIFLNEVGKVINEIDSSEEFGRELLIALNKDAEYLTDTCVYLLTEKQSNSITVYRKKSNKFTDRTLAIEAQKIYESIAFDSKLDKEEIKKGFIKIIKTYPYCNFGEYFYDMIRIFGFDNPEIVNAASYFMMKSREEILKIYSDFYLPEFESLEAEQNQRSVKNAKKNKWTAFLLCLFLGIFGAHKFYEGKAGMGVLYIFTAGLFLIGVLMDMVKILGRPEEYDPMT